MDKNLFLAELVHYIEHHTLVEIKGGTNRPAFLEIWMVTVGQRIFARSWGMSTKSWFTEFIVQGVGQLKLGDLIIEVQGRQLIDEKMNRLIDQAYQAKYTQKENEVYVSEITALKYADFTMEFFIINNCL